MIEDDDVPTGLVFVPPLAVMIEGPSSVDEDGGAARYTVRLNRSPSVRVSVGWAVSGTGDDATDAADFGGTLPSGTTEQVTRPDDHTLSGDGDVLRGERHGRRSDADVHRPHPRRRTGRKVHAAATGTPAATS